jgi:hypothetical protein
VTRAAPRRLLRPALAAALLGAGACAGAPNATPAQAPAPRPGQPSAQQPPAQQQQPAQAWPVRTREHVDLWLHGFALVVDDTARVPIFRRGYREAARARRARANAVTRLDAERDRLRQRLAANPALALNAQFVALAFPSWEALRASADALVQSGGDPRRARDEQTAGAIQFLAGVFATAADREWLRIFAGALEDERARYYHQEWLTLQRDRAAALAAADSVWQRAVRPRLQGFLAGTRQPGGDLVLSPVIGGEGRTQQGGARSNVVVVAFPERAADAADASYVAAHELVGALVGGVVADNTSPADQRAGLADRYVSAGQVRAGYLVLQRSAPAFAAGYARFYLREAGLPAPAAGGEGAALAAAFPLPAAMLDSITRQLELVQGGI